MEAAEFLDKYFAHLESRVDPTGQPEETVSLIRKMSFVNDMRDFLASLPASEPSTPQSIAQLCQQKQGEPAKRMAELCAKAARYDFLRVNWECNFNRRDKEFSFYYNNRGELSGRANSYNDIPDLESIIDAAIAARDTQPEPKFWHSEALSNATKQASADIKSVRESFKSQDAERATVPQPQK